MRSPADDQRAFLVGYAHSTRQEADLLLRAVEDLYRDWLGRASLRQQAAKLWKTHKGRLIPLLGGALAESFELLLKLAEPTGTVATATRNWLHGLIRANESLRSSGLDAPRLQYDQARTLLTLLAELTKMRVVLVLDAFEQSPDPEREAGNLHMFLSHVDEWPLVHVFTALRDPPHDAEHSLLKRESVAHEEHKAMVRAFAPAASFYSLPEMDLDEGGERGRITEYLREKLPHVAGVDDDLKLDLMGGYPGTLRRWIDENPMTEEDLRRLAEDSRLLRYREIEPAFERLRAAAEPLLDLALQLALLPEMTERAWGQYRGLFGADIDAALGNLRAEGLLESDRYPSFGLTGRLETTRAIAVERFGAHTRAAVRHLVPGLADAITGAHPRYLPLVFALAELQTVNQRLGAEAWIQGLCEAARAVLDPRVVDATHLVEATRQSHGLLLVAVALVEATNQAREKGDLQLRDALFAELRALSSRTPGDGAVREQLANAVFNAAIDVQQEGDFLGLDALLQELRSLAVRFPEDGAVRSRLAMVLVNAHAHGKSEGSLSRRDSLLDEIRAVAARFPGDGAVRHQFAKALLNAITNAKQEDVLARRNSLLDELRSLAGLSQDDRAVRGLLAKALANAQHDAKQEGDLRGRDDLLVEIRKMATRTPSDGAVREQLANALFNTVVDAEEERDLPRRDALLDEIRTLVARFPDDGAIRGTLGRALFNIHCHVKENLPQRDALLGEMRTLAARFPDDHAVREALARALANTLQQARQRGDLPRGGTLLDEIRALAARFPDDEAVREALARTTT